MELQAVAPNTRIIRWLIVAMAIFFVLGALALLFIVTHGPVARWPFETLWWTVAFLTAGAGGLTGWLLYSKNARVLIGLGRVGYRDLLGRRRTWTTDQIGRVVDMTVVYAGEKRPQRAVFFLGLDGHRLLAINKDWWDVATINAFVLATEKPVDFRDKPFSIKEARSEFPGAFGWASAHVTMIALAACAIAVAVVTGVSVILSAVMS